MDAIADFEDLLVLLRKHDVHYLIIGGLAFIYHARPRFTKDMDLWIEQGRENIDRANRALAEFGSPTLLDQDAPEQVVQLGLPPNRIDLLVEVGNLHFSEAWERRIEGIYGHAQVYWIDLDSLEKIKSAIHDPRHQDDARILREVRRLKKRRDPGRADASST